MKKRLTWIMSAAVLCGMAWAQAATPQSNNQANPNTSMSETAQPNRVAAGTVIPAELDKSIDAKKCKTGDPVVAKTTSDLLSNGQVVIPRGTKITGHVTAAKPHDKADPSSSVAIAFDQIAMKNKPPLAFQAEIQAMAKPQQSAAVAAAGGEPNGAGSGMSSPAANQGGGAGMGRAAASQGTSGAPSEGEVPPTDATAQQPAGVPLSASSTGVMGMEGISLSAGSDASQGTVIKSENKNVKLDSGTQLILKAK